MEKFKTSGQLTNVVMFEVTPDLLRHLATMLEEGSKMAGERERSILPVVQNGRTVLLVTPPKEKAVTSVATSFSSDDVHRTEQERAVLN